MAPEHATSDLSRREFLERTAYAAGLAGTCRRSRPTTILAEAAQAPPARIRAAVARATCRSTTSCILMMENRSFDHYFGWLRGYADADAARRRYPNAEGELRADARTPRRSAPAASVQGLRAPRPGPRLGLRAAPSCSGGFLAPGSAATTSSRSTYYNQGELGFIHEAARNYTLYDRYFCSLLGPTWPNRYYKWSAQSGGLKTNAIAPGGNNWETIFDRALRRTA